MPHMLVIEMITPKAAQAMLSTMVKNRALSQTKVLEYAIAMDEGRWSLNGETIKLDKLGRLFDGQNRLSACVLAGKPFRSFVARGIEDENAFATVDVGKNRTHGDIFGIAGFVSANQAAAAAAVMYAIKNCQMGWSGPLGRRERMRKSHLSVDMQVSPGAFTKEDLMRFAEPLRDEISACVRYAQTAKAKKLLAIGVMAGCLFLFREKSTVEAHEFFESLGEGAGLGATDPVLHLRERLQEHQAKRGIRMSRWFYVGLTIKAWNKRRSGENVRSLRVQDNEEFPVKIL